MKSEILVNIQRIMIFLRLDIKNEKGIEVLNICQQALAGELGNGEMCHAITEIIPDWKGQLLSEEGSSCAVPKEAVEFAGTAIRVMEDGLYAGKYDMAYDIADLLHILLDVVIKNDKKEMKSYWKLFIEKFHKKWKCDIFQKYEYFFNPKKFQYHLNKKYFLRRDRQ